MEDHICHLENLPEDTLIHILSLLPLVDSVVMRTVSRNWNNLWKMYCARNSNLCFDFENLIGLRQCVPESYKIPSCAFFKFYRKNISKQNFLYRGINDRSIDEFIQGVNMILHYRRSEEQDLLPGAKSLKIVFPLLYKHSRHVDDWILSTVTSTTRHLVLDFAMGSIIIWEFEKVKHLYKFPFEALSSREKLYLEYLKLKYISFKLPQNFNGFCTLKKLELKWTDVTEADLIKFLTGCPFLEFLKIVDCQNLFAFNASLPLPHLKHFLMKCRNEIRKIKLHAENLSSFDYSGDIMGNDFVVNSSQKLIKVALDHYPMEIGSHVSFRSVSNDFPFVCYLFLHNLLLRDFITILQGSIFAHLKFLSVHLRGFSNETESGVQNMLTLTNASAPFLEELELQFFGMSNNFKKNDGDDERIDGDPYNHLKSVALVGFTAEAGHMYLARYFLMNAKRLQVMTLDPLPKFYKNFKTRKMKLQVILRKTTMRRCRRAYRRLLFKYAPENVQLVLVDLSPFYNVKVK